MDVEQEETVYGTHEDSRVMSERVSSLASSIYKEFERMIKKYDEDVVKELMPLVVGILESLDLAYGDKQENEVELELLRDDNEQLLTQYEREKQLRKGVEQKFLEAEDSREEETKELQSKVESLESIVRMFELKAKNAQDHVSRLEEKETEMKKEYNKLHERYTELFRTHMDYMERTKMLMGGDRILDTGISPKGRSSFHLPNLKAVTPSISTFSGGETPTKPGSSPPAPYTIVSPKGTMDSNTSLKNELKDLESPQITNKEKKDSINKSVGVTKMTETAEKGQITDVVEHKERSTDTKSATATSQEANAVTNMAPAVTDTAPAATNIAPTATETVPAVTVTSPAGSQGVTVTAPVGSQAASVSSKPLGDTLDAKKKPQKTLEAQFTESLDSFGDGLPPHVTDLISTPELEDIDDAGFGKKSRPIIVEQSGPKNESSIFEELTSDVIGEMDDGVDITGMGKEVENLILENTELLATKNALNVVKDDLIAKVDELTSEQEILREEIESLQAVKSRLKVRVTELEDELKKVKEELEKKSHAAVPDEEEIPMAQRKRFTRVEMARVLMERNQYKERLMELQEAVRWTEMIRASREHPELVQGVKKKGSIWNFFSNLVGPAQPQPKKKGQMTTI